MLWQALGQRPPTWAHVPVLVNEQRKKLSKRRDKVALEQYREDGIIAPAMINYLMTLGWAPSGDKEIVPWQQIVDEFRLENVNHSPAFFDEKKLAAFNGDYLRMLDIDAFISACGPWMTGDSVPWSPSDFDAKVFREIAPLVQTRVGVLSEVPAMIDFLFVKSPVIDSDARDKAMKPEWATQLLRDAVAVYEACVWNADTLKSELEKIGEVHGAKLGKAQAPVRVAVTGRSVGPPLFESLELLGRDRVVARMKALLG